MTESKTYNVTSANQSGGITAGEVHIGQQPRELQPGMLDGFKAMIPPGSKVRVVAAMSDGEACRFAGLFREFARGAGYDLIEDIDQAAWFPPVNGLQITKSEEGIFEVRVGHNLPD